MKPRPENLLTFFFYCAILPAISSHLRRHPLYKKSLTFRLACDKLKKHIVKGENDFETLGKGNLLRSEPKIPNCLLLPTTGR